MEYALLLCQGYVLAVCSTDLLDRDLVILAIFHSNSPPPTCPLQTVRGPSVMELQLREELALWWTDQCWAMYDAARKWI